MVWPKISYNIAIITMFTNTTSGMSIAVNGGSIEENNQLCTVVAAALRTHGFRNVHLEASNEVVMPAHHDMDIIHAMRGLNPDLFDTSVHIAGESEDDMRASMAAMGFGDQPFAFQVARGNSF